MIEELADEMVFSSATPDRQRKLIARHCDGIAQKIQTAQSDAEAATIAAHACDSFAQECKSPLLRRALEEFVRRLTEEHRKPR